MDSNFFRQIIEILEKNNDDTTAFGKLQGFDPSTKQALADLKSKYPNAPDELSALLKYITRISSHSKEEDQEHEMRLSDIEQRLENLEQRLQKKDLS